MEARETEILGQQSYPSLAAIPEPVDVVNVFRAPSALPGIVDAWEPWWLLWQLPGAVVFFVAGLADLLLERAAEARGEEPVRATWRDLDSHPSVCPLGCCPNLRTAEPALCGRD